MLIPQHFIPSHTTSTTPAPLDVCAPFHATFASRFLCPASADGRAAMAPLPPQTHAQNLSHARPPIAAHIADVCCGCCARYMVRSALKQNKNTSPRAQPPCRHPLCPLHDELLPLDASGLKHEQLSYSVEQLQKADGPAAAMAAMEALARWAGPSRPSRHSGRSRRSGQAAACLRCRGWQGTLCGQRGGGGQCGPEVQGLEPCWVRACFGPGCAHWWSAPLPGSLRVHPTFRSIQNSPDTHS